MTRLWLVRFVEINFNKEMESSETTEVFIRRKKVHVNRHTWAGFERELRSLIWGTSPGFPLANHLALLGSESIFGITQGPPLCARESLSQDGL